MPLTPKNSPLNCAGFQKQMNKTARQIITPIQIISAHFQGEEYKRYNGTVNGLWDTGATSTTIATALADKLGLPCIGKEIMKGAGGEYEAKKYLAGLILPNNTIIPYIILYGFSGAKNFDILVGMDIITRGDFLLSSTSSTSFFSFQHPSFGGFFLTGIKYVYLHNGLLCEGMGQRNVKFLKIGRNTPCPCGSGKKYKHCCGR